MKSIQQYQYKPDPNAKQNTKLVISDSAKTKVDELFTALEAMFPAWRVAFKGKDEKEAIKNTKLVWVTALVRNRNETGMALNIERGLVHAEKSESDFLPSVGKFIGWCNQDDALTERARKALANFSSDEGVIDAVEKETRARCGYEARRLPPEKRDKLFLETYYDVYQSRPELINAVLIQHKTGQELRKSIYTRRDNQAAINQAGIDKLKKLFGECS